MERKGELGISTLILAVAMILVAAILFAVFTQSAFQVGQEAKSVGMVAKSNVGTAIQVQKLYAEDGTDGSVDYFYEELKLPAGSDEMRLNDTLLTMSLANDSQTYSYDSTDNCSDTSGGPTSFINRTVFADKFGVVYVRGSSTYSDAVVAGEFFRICFIAPHAVSKDERIYTDFFSKFGFRARVDVTYAKKMADKYVYLFP
jgi:archaellin